MISLKNYTCKLILLCLLPLCIYAGPTQRHLEFRTLDEISKNIEPAVSEKIPLFLEISSHETEDTFFGYHGMSQNNRLFQDILNVVFEDVLHIPIPKDFYFLRIPGESTWNWASGKDSFLSYYGNRPVSMHHKELIISNFLKIVEKDLDLQMTIDQFTPVELSTLWQYFQDHLEYMFKTDWISKIEKYAMPLEYTWEVPILNEHLPDLMDVIVKKGQKLNPEITSTAIKEWFKNKFRDFYDNCIVFQLRELGSLDPKILNAVGNLDLKFDDTRTPQNGMLVSLNTSILGNYQDPGCFSAGIFVENESVLGGDAHLESLLIQFFTKIGLDPSVASLLWEEGQKLLNEAGEHQGCLLQLFDESALIGKQPFSLVDKDTYVSFKHGLPVPGLISSTCIKGEYSLTQGYRDLELRLVVNNQTTLNPYSNMRIIRYDSLSVKDSDHLISKIKEILKDTPQDELKIQQYQKFLNALWEMN